MHFNEMKLVIKKAEFMSINLENISTGKHQRHRLQRPSL